MKKNIGLVLSLIGLILIGTSIFMSMSTNNDNKSNNENKENTEKQENTEKKDNTEKKENTEKPVERDKNKEDNDLSKTDLSVLNSIPRIENKKLENSKYVFKDKKVSIDDIDAKDLYSSVIYSIIVNNSDECDNKEECDLKVSLDAVKSEIKKLYGDINKQAPNEITENSIVNCKLNNNLYLCKYVESDQKELKGYVKYFYATKDYVNIKRTNSVEKVDNYMYVYEKFLNIRLESPDTMDYDSLSDYKYKIYKNTNTNDLASNDIILGSDYYKEDDTKSFQIKVIEKYIQNAQFYKHTFKLDSDNTYKWVSTEPVE